MVVDEADSEASAVARHVVASASGGSALFGGTLGDEARDCGLWGSGGGIFCSDSGAISDGSCGFGGGFCAMSFADGGNYDVFGKSADIPIHFISSV